MKYLLIAIACLFLGACGTFGVKPSNPEQAAIEAKMAFKDVLTLLDTYDHLPACGTDPTVLLCSTPAVKAKIKQAVDVAAPAVDAAENAVRNPAFSTGEMNALVSTAQAAVAALTAIEATLPTHKAK